MAFQRCETALVMATYHLGSGFNSEALTSLIEGQAFRRRLQRMLLPSLDGPDDQAFNQGVIRKSTSTDCYSLIRGLIIRLEIKEDHATCFVITDAIFLNAHVRCPFVLSVCLL